jgi:hypothetical protein
MLQFIDNTTINRETRRIIRSHAAKGKNIGKGRPRRKPAQVQGRPPKLAADHARPSASDPNTTEEEDLSDTLALVERPMISLLTTLNLPFELDPHSKASFYQGRYPCAQLP